MECRVYRLICLTSVFTWLLYVTPEAACEAGACLLVAAAGMVKPPAGVPALPGTAAPAVPGYGQQPGGSFQEGPIGLAGRMAGM